MIEKLEDLDPVERADILERRLERSEKALRDAEEVLEQRMRDLVRANEELGRRESCLLYTSPSPRD